MTDLEKKAIASAFFDCINERDYEGMGGLMASDMKYHGGPGIAPTAEGIRTAVQRFVQGFPDLEIKVEEVVIEDEKVAVRSLSSGTQKGEYLGIPASGCKVKFHGIDIFEIQNGQITQVWHFEDSMAVLRQIGAMSL